DRLFSRPRADGAGDRVVPCPACGDYRDLAADGRRPGDDDLVVRARRVTRGQHVRGERGRGPAVPEGGLSGGRALHLGEEAAVADHAGQLGDDRGGHSGLSKQRHRVDRAIPVVYLEVRVDLDDERRGGEPFRSLVRGAGRGGREHERHHGDDRHAQREGGERTCERGPAGSYCGEGGGQHARLAGSSAETSSRAMWAATASAVGRASVSVTRPSARKITRSAYAAAIGSWVTMMIVCWCSVTMPLRSRRTSRDVRVSSAPVGSSAKSTCGVVTRARAIATRC